MINILNIENHDKKRKDTYTKYRKNENTLVYIGYCYEIFFILYF